MGKKKTAFIGTTTEDLEPKKSPRHSEQSEESSTSENTDPSVTPQVEKKTKEKKDYVKVNHNEGKNHKKAKKQIDKTKQYSLSEAVDLLKKIAYAKFEESVEIHMNVVKQGLKGEVELPHSTGKTVKVAIVNDEVLTQIENNEIDFDILISHPRFMPKLAKYAKILGPRGLMPNPKAGTISPEPEKVAEKFQKGTLRWKTEPKFPLIHQLVAKLNSDSKEIVENSEALIKSVGKNNIEKIFIKSTMSPGLQIDIESV